MKRRLLSIFSLIFFVCGLSSAQEIVVTPELVQASFVGADLSDNDLDLYKEIDILNNTSETMELQWFREVPADCPDARHSVLCPFGRPSGQRISRQRVSVAGRGADLTGTALPCLVGCPGQTPPVHSAEAKQQWADGL